MKVAKDIDDYISRFPKPVQKSLKQLRSAIRKAAVGCTEKISYGMPAFFLTENLVYFAAYKTHIGFYPTSNAMVVFEKELAIYPTSKGAVRFTIDEPLPLGLVQKITKFRVKESMARQSEKKAVASKKRKKAKD